MADHGTGATGSPVDYENWGANCDTLHGHTQVLGKLAVELAPPEPQLQHAALQLTARGWETLALPAADGSGTLTVALGLCTHEAVVEHSGGGRRAVPLTLNRSVGAVTRDVSPRSPNWPVRCGSTCGRRKSGGRHSSTRTTNTRPMTPKR